MADTSYSRKSAFGIALLVVSVLALLFFLFIMTQRGGEVTGDVGADGINPEPTQIEVEEVEAIEGPVAD